MSRKIIVLNIVLLLLLFVVFISGILVFNYPTNLSDIGISIEEWGYFFLLLIGSFILSWILSFIPIKHFSRRDKWAGFLAILNSIFIVWMLSVSVPQYFENKKHFEDLEKEVVAKAQRDIKNDDVVWFFEHGFIIFVDDYEKSRKQEDSIYEKYGIKVESMGCIATPHQDVLEQKYKAIVKDYLDKRNGKDWEERLEKELESIK